MAAYPDHSLYRMVGPAGKKNLLNLYCGNIRHAGI
jgi:hypothetical protein